VVGATLLVAFVNLPASAQNAPTDGMTPSGLAPGSASGTYSLSGFDNVNLYNGNLNLALPLLGVGGRGGASTQMTLNFDSVRWVIDDGGPNPNWWEGIRPGYGPGVLQARNKAIHLIDTGPTHTLPRLTFTAGDGTEYELVDTYHGGQYYTTNPRSRGQVFVSHSEGAFIRFVSNSTLSDGGGTNVFSAGLSGYLYFPNGTRYEITDGLVMKIRDGNGNLISFAYDTNRRVTTVTDSLNREVTVSYANMTSVFYDQINYKGFNGTNGTSRALKIWHSDLDDVLRSGYSIQTYSELFPQATAGNTTEYNPNDMVSAVELPDGRQYQFEYNSYGEVARIELPTGGAIEYDYVEMGDGTTFPGRSQQWK